MYTRPLPHFFALYNIISRVISSNFQHKKKNTFEAFIPHSKCVLIYACEPFKLIIAGAVKRQGRETQVVN